MLLRDNRKRAVRRTESGDRRLPGKKEYRFRFIPLKPL